MIAPKPIVEAHASETTRQKNNFAKSNLIRIGYFLLAVSFSFYLLTEYFPTEKRQDLFTLFIVHYLVAFVYAALLITTGAYGIRKSWKKENLDKTVILLNLFLISAYALNRQLPVFAESTTWLCVYLVATSLAMLSYRYFNRLNPWVNRFQHLILGSAIVFYFYLAIYVANIYGIGCIGIIFFGIGAHAFVPLTLLTACFFLARYAAIDSRISKYWIVGGSALTIVFVMAFMGEWNSRISNIEASVNQSVIYNNEGLPDWVKVAQEIKRDWISERIIKSDLVYTTHNQNVHWDFFPTRLWSGEKKKHDPLVFISSLISKCSLSEDNRVKILQSVFADRHAANERLWSGDNLTTSYIVTDVDIYPSLRLAYIEKYLNVRNNAYQGGFGNNAQEAIYTFQLPEGSVATSLSLWINGKEEKGILTSKQKATKAYKTIVGVEARDPSVIHWQEGNTVTVRVFPCTTEEERKFKIGITTPLIQQGDEIIFKNIPFLGPSHHSASEAIRIRFVDAAESIALPGIFKKNEKGDYILEHLYDPEFQVRFKAVPLPANQFSFDGYAYSIQANAPAFESVNIENIFLDLNNSWSRNDIAAMKMWLDNYKVYTVLDSDFIQLTNDNWADLTDVISEHNFSIFPFHRISNPDHSLVVTKGKSLTPHLSDFKESEFSENVSKYFASGKKVKVYNLDGDVSTYISSFREFRGIKFAKGDVDRLHQLLKENKFPRIAESAEKIVLHDANVVVTKTKIKNEQLTKDNAPDHLARLFAYNNIMRKVGTNYFNDEFISNELVDEASTAYVVSPVSSLIVLETQKDYERFGIEDKVNSLHNAMKQSTGAVPEPHEWALIILFLLFIAYMKIRRSKLKYA